MPRSAFIKKEKKIVAKEIIPHSPFSTFHFQLIVLLVSSIIMPFLRGIYEVTTRYLRPSYDPAS
ncbi:MAG: hypothetical protein EZS26_003026 [Candidatus Ordinivivax streblomastigis]|uniref:Uncharacterized protein n=1 Tax=Candidatus Ordinivivax streblomastigis TaxID=2540710 RepID=A0A5M8NXZ6_9BACT|nr:MAG: hypothetical protein EZS26_003026 [Candidatus Ordinivivax streblomastigis]